MTATPFATSGTVLPVGAEALNAVEDALDHFVDGPRTSPSMMRRLLIRACDDDGELNVREAIERFGQTYDSAFAIVPAAAMSPADVDGGVRGRLLQFEAVLRREWSSVREEIVTAGVLVPQRFNDEPSDRASIHTSNPNAATDLFAIPFSDDGFDGALDVDPDEPILMLEPAWSIERRERRRARWRALGTHAARAVLYAAAVGAVLAVVVLIVGAS